MDEETAVTETDQEAVSSQPEKADLAQQGQPAAPARNFDAEAREMGWVPKEEFQGPEGKWKPAQQFVEDGERILPIVRSQLKREKEERERERQEFSKRLERMERISSENMQRAKAQHEAELQRVRREQREAVEAGDAGRFDELERQREALSKTTFEPPAEDAKVEYERKVTDFQRANQWYGADEELTAFADGFSQRLAAKNPTITLEENLRQTVEKVRETFPARFGVKPRAANGHAAVDGGGDFAGPPQKKTLADRLPPEARAKAKEDVNAGLYKNAEEWAKVYFG